MLVLRSSARMMSSRSCWSRKASDVCWWLRHWYRTPFELKKGSMCAKMTSKWLRMETKNQNEIQMVPKCTPWLVHLDQEASRWFMRHWDGRKWPPETPGGLPRWPPMVPTEAHIGTKAATHYEIKRFKKILFLCDPSKPQRVSFVDFGEVSCRYDLTCGQWAHVPPKWHTWDAWTDQNRASQEAVFKWLHIAPRCGTTNKSLGSTGLPTLTYV